ncbi:MAG TPA: hypothetical protein VIK33_16235 [Anaerolineae bacterium]
MRVCPTCGKRFDPADRSAPTADPVRDTERIKYCSEKCARKAENRRHYQAHKASIIKRVRRAKKQEKKIMKEKKVDQMSRYEILDALVEDGYNIDPMDAAEVSKTIQLAARSGALVWTKEHIVSTLHNRPLTLRPGE